MTSASGGFFGQTEWPISYVCTLTRRLSFDTILTHYYILPYILCHSATTTGACIAVAMKRDEVQLV